MKKSMGILLTITMLTALVGCAQPRAQENKDEVSTGNDNTSSSFQYDEYRSGEKACSKEESEADTSLRIDESTCEEIISSQASVITLEIPFHWGGNGDEKRRALSISCQNEFVAEPGLITFEDKKIVELVSYSPDRFEKTLKQLSDNAMVKEIGERTFWVVSEEYNILEKPKKIPYIIWQYFFFDGELYYNISFFENQEKKVVSVSEFEEILETLKINEVVM